MDESGSTHGPVDARFLLANERTFLAYTRTALALQVAGLGIMQFLTQGHLSVRYYLGVALVAAGSFLGLAGYRRYLNNDRAIREGHDIGHAHASVVVAAAVAVVPLTAGVALAVVALR